MQLSSRFWQALDQGSLVLKMALALSRQGCAWAPSTWAAWVSWGLWDNSLGHSWTVFTVYLISVQNDCATEHTLFSYSSCLNPVFALRENVISLTVIFPKTRLHSALVLSFFCLLLMLDLYLFPVLGILVSHKLFVFFNENTNFYF